MVTMVKVTVMLMVMYTVTVKVTGPCVLLQGVPPQLVHPGEGLREAAQGESLEESAPLDSPRLLGRLDSCELLRSRRLIARLEAGL